MIDQRRANKATKKYATFGAIFLLLLFELIYAERPLDLDCSNKRGNYSTNSTFESNLKRLLNSLPENAARNEGFFNGSIGVGDNSVSGRALCRGDVKSSDCIGCLGNASQDISSMCKNKQAVIRYELCQLDYRTNIGDNRYNGLYSLSNKDEKPLPPNIDQSRFSQVLLELMKDLSEEAARSRLMFAAQSREFSKEITVYGVAQCARDLSSEDCREILRSAQRDLIGCCGLYQGGTVYNGAFSVRFELYKFYNDSLASNGKTKKTKIAISIAFFCVFVMVVIVGTYVHCLRKKKKKQGLKRQIGILPHADVESRTTNYLTIIGKYVLSSQDMPFVEVPIVNASTELFLDSNKIGQGGFGIIYKGILPSGDEVAVKRLFKKSWQGVEALKNEVMLIAKLQHRNLVKLVGCDLEGNEKLLIYEYMPNRSLDLFLFDMDKKLLLDWRTRFNIIDGIARGLVYLHEDSRLKIIHRDLKPSNILLDRDMVAKISDFGMARIFCDNQNPTNTKRIVGTYGYMAPEYAMRGLFSIKSDVFSFGVILLETISGQRNSHFSANEKSLLSHAWDLLNEERELDIVDPMLTREPYPKEEIVRCINIGLLCVQENPTDRPKMSQVVHLLNGGEMTLSQPSQPPISLGRRLIQAVDHDLRPVSTGSSVNYLTDDYSSVIFPR